MNIYLLWLGLNKLLVCEEKKFKYTIISEIMNLGVDMRGVGLGMQLLFLGTKYASYCLSLFFAYFLVFRNVVGIGSGHFLLVVQL
jgi:hypothetical protein